MLIALALAADGLLIWNRPVGTSPPSDIRIAVSTPTAVTVHWAPPRNSADVDHYLIVRDGRVVATAGATGRSYTDGGLLPGTAYGYRVVAITIHHKAFQSAEHAVTVPVTSPVAVTAPSVGGDWVLLTWTAALQSPLPDRYTVFRDGQPVATVKGSVTSYTDKGLVAVKVYRYEVVATRAAASSAPSSALSVRTLGPAPTALTAAAVTATTARLYWYPPEGMPVPDSYLIIVNGAERATVPGYTTSWVGTGLLPGTSYTLQVGARWNVERSELSVPLQISTRSTDAPLDGPYTVRLATSTGQGWTGTWLITSKCAAATCDVVATVGETSEGGIAPFSLTLTPEGTGYTGQTPTAVTGCEYPGVLTVELSGPSSGQWQAWTGVMTVDPAGSSGLCGAEGWTADMNASR